MLGSSNHKEDMANLFQRFVIDCGDCSFRRATSKANLLNPENKKHSKYRDLAKVVGIVMVPIIALLIMTTMALNSSLTVYNESKEAQTDVKFSLQVRLLR